jgi:hypothetical protein
MRTQLHYLELVYPPISNQEAEWLKGDPEVQQAIDNSNLYFIGQKPESFFAYDEAAIEKFDNERVIYFKYLMADLIGHVELDLHILLDSRQLPGNTEMDIELGEKYIRIWNITDGKREIIDWLSTEKLLIDRSHNFPYIRGFENYRDFSRYFLHYVGISKKGSSLNRLVIQPHDKRIRILSGEYPFRTTSRVTDEIILFFFHIKSAEIKVYEDSSEFTPGEHELADHIRIIADAEKAFVKILDTKYNEVKFKDYPESTDGLFTRPIDSLSYCIDEDINFFTKSTSIFGHRKKAPKYQEQGDWIAVTKEDVVLMKIEDFQ